MENNVCGGFVTYGLHYVEIVSFYAHFLESFYHKWVLNFPASIKIIIFFIFQLIYMLYYIDCFAYVEESLHLWDKLHLIMLYVFNVLKTVF